MPDQQASERILADPTQLARSLADIAERSQRLLTDWMTRNGLANSRETMSESLQIAGSFADLTTHLVTDPARLAQAQVSLWTAYMELWQNTATRMLGFQTEPLYEPLKGDLRFQHPAWRENEIFNYIKQSYLLVSRWLEGTVRDVHDVDRMTKQKVEFYTRQFVNAVSPSNFAFTNPEVIQATIESRGENLIRGLENLLADLEQSDAMHRTSLIGHPGFAIGETVATTPGKIVFRNDLMELIQYSPTTEMVLRRPLLFIPPWINKFYIMDLGENKSWVKWAVDQGHTVFLISWVNPIGDLTEKSFEDYLLEGPIAALDVIQRVTGEAEVNAVAYCVGGVLLAVTMAYLARKGDERIATGTFLATLLDFSEPGDLGVFIDEATMAELAKAMSEDRRLDAGSMETFNLLRENDLIWSFVVNNYLLGNDRFPFDLLYWNCDATVMPHAMHDFYLQKFYKGNALVKPGGVTLAGEPIDLRKVRAPTYFLSTREDHIAPWRSAYKGMRLLSGPVRFTLAGCGHISGIINPPTGNKHGYWTSERTPPADPESWLSKSKRREDSWWTDWDAWIKRQAGQKDRVPARVPGGGRSKVLGDAPGTYIAFR
jgi:polyhydroxyalkanoate synthase